MAAVWKRVKYAVQHLRWRLTISYMAVTVGTLLTLVLILSAILFSGSLGSDEYFTPEFWYQATAAHTVPMVRQILTTAPELLPLWVDTLETRSPPREIMQFANGTQLVIRHDIQLSVLVIGADGTLLAASNPQLTADIAPGEPFDGSGIPGLDGRLALVLAGEEDVAKLTFTEEAADRIGFVVPIPKEDDAGSCPRRPGWRCPQTAYPTGHLDADAGVGQAQPDTATARGGSYRSTFWHADCQRDRRAF